MNQATTDTLVKLLTVYQTLKNLMKELDVIEADTKTPANQRLEKIKEINQQIDKVEVEIDTLEKEVKLLKQYRVN